MLSLSKMVFESSLSSQSKEMSFFRRLMWASIPNIWKHKFMGITSIVTRQGGSYTENDTFSVIIAIRVIFCIRPPMQSYSTIITRHGGSYTENDTFSVIMTIRVIFCIRHHMKSCRWHDKIWGWTTKNSPESGIEWQNFGKMPNKRLDCSFLTTFNGKYTKNSIAGVERGICNTICDMCK